MAIRLNMAYQEEFCQWFDFGSLPAFAKQFMQERKISNLFKAINKCHSYNHENDVQTIEIDSYGCVDLDQIEEQEVWNQMRMERLSKWVTKDNLRMFPREVQVDDTGEPYFTECKDFRQSLPVLSRVLTPDDIKHNKKPKFYITDGIHRIAKAKELGLKCIMAEVEEMLKIKKEDLENE